MSIRHLLTASGVGLLAVVGSATPAAAQLLFPLTGPGAYALTAGRFWSLVGALLALAGVVVGGLALARPASRIGTGPRGAIAALAAGLAGAIIGGLVVAGADGGPGSGSGIVGGFLAVVIGLIGTALGAAAVVHFHRTGRRIKATSDVIPRRSRP